VDILPQIYTKRCISLTGSETRMVQRVISAVTAVLGRNGP